MANINIYGKLYNNTVDKVIAGAEQIYDTTQGKMQDIINAELYAASGDITDKIGQANGIAGLDSDGKVPSSQLPSYVDDVLEYDNQAGFPQTGESGKIYVAKDTNKTYRWSGSTYVEISQSLALGETASTAYAGDKGAANRTAINSLPDSIISNLALTNITGTTVGLSISKVNKSGLNYGTPTGSVLNIPVATDTAAGLMTADNYALLSALDQSIDVLDGKGILLGEISTNAQASAVELSFTTFQKSSSGTIENGTAKEQIAAATPTVAGVMSAADKAKLDGIAANANAYVLPTATASILGGVKSSITGTVPGKDYLVQVNSDGTMKVNVPWIDTKYILPAATTSALGGIKVGAGLTVTADGILSATGGGEADSVAWANVIGKPSEFNPPLASATTRGGVKVGSGLKMNEEVLTVDLGAQSPVVVQWKEDIQNAVEEVEQNVAQNYLKTTGGALTGDVNSLASIIVNTSDSSVDAVKIFADNDETAGGAGHIIVTDDTNNISITPNDIKRNGESIIPVALTTGEIEAICV